MLSVSSHNWIKSHNTFKRAILFFPTGNAENYQKTLWLSVFGLQWHSGKKNNNKTGFLVCNCYIKKNPHKSIRLVPAVDELTFIKNRVLFYCWQHWTTEQAKNYNYIYSCTDRQWTCQTHVFRKWFELNAWRRLYTNNRRI